MLTLRLRRIVPAISTRPTTGAPMSNLRCTLPLLLSAALPAQWLQVAPTQSPSARSAHAMAAVGTGTVYLFGGWPTAQRNGSHTPGDCGLAFDANRRLIVRFGGIAGSTTNGATFEFGARAREFGTGCPGSHGVPTLSTDGAPRLGTSWSSACRAATRM
jgi:hypothetical protein